MSGDQDSGSFGFRQFAWFGFGPDSAVILSDLVVWVEGSPCAAADCCCLAVVGPPRSGVTYYWTVISMTTIPTVVMRFVSI